MTPKDFFRKAVARAAVEHHMRYTTYRPQFYANFGGWAAAGGLAARIEPDRAVTILGLSAVFSAAMWEILSQSSHISFTPEGKRCLFQGEQLLVGEKRDLLRLERTGQYIHAATYRHRRKGGLPGDVSRDIARVAALAVEAASRVRAYDADFDLPADDRCREHKLARRRDIPFTRLVIDSGGSPHRLELFTLPADTATPAPPAAPRTKKSFKPGDDTVDAALEVDGWLKRQVRVEGTFAAPEENTPPTPAAQTRRMTR